MRYLQGVEKLGETRRFKMEDKTLGRSIEGNGFHINPDRWELAPTRVVAGTEAFGIDLVVQ